LAKSDYCAENDSFHMAALYAGKGNIGTCLRDRWKSKNFSDQPQICFTYTELPNRHSKYFVQFLLDVYDFPFNKAEDSGVRTLCEHFAQYEAG